MVDGIHFGFQGQNDIQTSQQPFQRVYHVNIIGISHFIFISSSFGAGYIHNLIFSKMVDGIHFEFQGQDDLKT